MLTAKEGPSPETSSGNGHHSLVRWTSYPPSGEASVVEVDGRGNENTTNQTALEDQNLYPESHNAALVPKQQTQPFEQGIESPLRHPAGEMKPLKIGYRHS